jgi:hypothetical protein
MKGTQFIGEPGATSMSYGVRHETVGQKKARLLRSVSLGAVAMVDLVAVAVSALGMVTGNPDMVIKGAGVVGLSIPIGAAITNLSEYKKPNYGKRQ